MNKFDVYFSAADRQMEPFLLHNSFDRHFIYSALFQGNLIVPDIFFFISNHIRDRVLSKSRSHFVFALINGIVNPTFRSNVEGNFTANLAEIRSQGIQGILPEADLIGNKLDKLLAGSLNYRFKQWPSDLLSEGFARICKQSLLSTRSESDENFTNLWDSVQNLREVSVYGGMELSSGSGLQRGATYNAIARYYNFSYTSIDDIRTILNNIENPIERIKVSRVLKWINYCYHFNQGMMFGLQPALSEMDSIDITFSDAFYSRIDFNSPVNVISKSVEIPSVDQLLTVPPDKLFDARLSDEGAQYFELLDTWQSHPSELSAESLIRALEIYSHSICSTYVQHGTNVLRPKHVIQANLPTSNSPAASFVFDRILSLCDELITPIGLLTYVSDTIAGAYIFLPVKAKKLVDGAIKLNEKIDFHIEPRRQLLIMKQNENFTGDARFR